MSNNSNNRKSKLPKEYEQYTFGLALLDAVPVLVFLMTGVIVYLMFDNKLFLAGVLCAFIGGLSKVLWKFGIVIRKRNSALLTGIFHVMLPVGFILMMWSVIYTALKQLTGGVPLEQSIFMSLFRALTMRPAMWCFIGGFAGMILMGYLGANMDESAKANWIEEIINTLAQSAFLAGVILVYLGTFYAAGDAAMQAIGSNDVVQVSEISSQAAGSSANSGGTDSSSADDSANSGGTDSSSAGDSANSGETGSSSANESAASGGNSSSSADDSSDSTESGNVYFFDGPGKDTALVFYPGAKVEASSYAPLMSGLAQAGIDCYLCQMPENLALLDKDLANDVRAANSYEHWYIGGHSLGGATAAMYLAEDGIADNWDGLILLAAYPTDKLYTPVLSIYGTEDKVLNRDKYLSAQTNGLWPKDFTEVIIEGGNHARFGDYGVQKGDGIAKISAEEQTKQTVKAVDKWVEEHN